MFRSLLASTAVLLGSLVAAGSPADAASNVIFQPAIPNVSGLVTNEYTYWNPTNTESVQSGDWDMTSGSFFSSKGVEAGVGSTGRVDNLPVDPRSAKGTNSSVFRLHTKRADFGDVNVRFKLNLESMTSTPTTPPVAWDGVHIWLHYQSEQSLYYASVARRDGKVLIKKKCPGGISNGGTYHTMTREVAGFPIAFNTWWYVSATIKTNADGSVSITLFQNDKAIVSVTDTGTGCAPITGPGAVGIRGDNSRFRFHTFQVRSAV